MLFYLLYLYIASKYLLLLHFIYTNRFFLYNIKHIVCCTNQISIALHALHEKVMLLGMEAT